MNPVTDGLAALGDPFVLLCIGLGAIIGMLVGTFPGVTATMAVALASSFTLTLEPVAGLAVLLTIYVAANFGDRVPAILINTPGTPASIATTFDGYPMAKRGLAGVALTTSAFASAGGTLVGLIVLVTAAIPLSRLALEFGPPETFALVLFGLAMMISISGPRIITGLIAGAGGLLLATVGRDPITGADRFTFGVLELSDGIPFIAAILGLFGVAEILSDLARSRDRTVGLVQHVGRWWPNRSELRRMGKPFAIGAGVGAVVGAVPATGGDIGGVLAWTQAKRASRTPEEFGQGSIEGLTAADTSSNATLGPSVTTTLALGIPGDSVMAVMIGSLVIWGIQPGPSLFANRPDLVFTIAGIMAIAMFVALGLSLLRLRGVARLLQLPPRYLWTIVLAACVVGTYSINNSLVDVAVMLAFGVLGTVMRRFDVPIGPLVLGLLLGELAEANLRRSLEIGGIGTIVESPIAMTLFTITVLALAGPSIRRAVSRRRTSIRTSRTHSKGQS